MRFRDLLIALILVVAPSVAEAHPHVWVDAASEVLFDAKGRIAAIRHHWLFDEAFSAYALQGLDTNRDGKYSAEELKPLAKENVESLKDFGYFTFLNVGDYQAGFSDPKDYHLDLVDGRLTLHFTLPLAMPLLTRGTAVLSVYDPDYYVDFELPSAEAVRLVNAPVGCRLTVHPAAGPSAEAAAALAAVGADQRALPQGMQSLTAGTENTAEVNCGGTDVAAANPSDAISNMSGTNGGDLTALPAAGATVAENSSAAQPDAAQASSGEAAAPETPRVGLLQRISAQIMAWQATFNRDLTGGLKGLKNGGAFWWLGSISFLYGIVHAAGPGHGKVVISTYLVANEARIRRGVVIAFIAAFVQAVVAVAIIGLMAAVLNMTSMAIDATAKAFEAGSFGLVGLLGLYLLARKGRAAWATVNGGDPHAHHHHGHSHAHAHAHDHDDASCGHDHIPDPATLKPGLSGAAAAIVSVGMRPCSGALIVLVFALAQGVFWAGVASTFLMALGTAITVAALAALATGAKDIARFIARGDDRRGSQIMLALELAAAALITVLGVVLCLATLYSGSAPSV